MYFGVLTAVFEALMAVTLQATSCTNWDLCKVKPCLKGLNDECQCSMSRIRYKHRWSHPRGKRHHLVPPPTWSVLFIIHHLDKLFLIPTLICPPRPLVPSLSRLGKSQKRGRRGAFTVRVIFLPWSLSDKCVCSFVSGATLNQEEVEHRKNLEGLLIRKASL